MTAAEVHTQTIRKYCRFARRCGSTRRQLVIGATASSLIDILQSYMYDSNGTGVSFLKFHTQKVPNRRVGQNGWERG